MNRVLEICANSMQSALAAEAGGAQRIELCQNLEQGGITPSYGLIQQVQHALTIPVFVLIRPRPGHFVYDDNEMAIMVTDIQQCRALGCAGVVLGVLDAIGHVDTTRCRMLMAAAGPLQVTFHRAFDSCINQAQALEDIVTLGCQRILTSGGHATALAGQQQLASLVRQASGRISIMPGAGIKPTTVQELAASTGATEFHASATRLRTTSSGLATPVFDVALLETDQDIVARLVAELNK
jgi:copper homeostasis protein